MKIMAATIATLALSAFATASYAQETQQYSSQPDSQISSSQDENAIAQDSDSSFRPPEHGRPGRPGPGRPGRPPERRPDHNRWGHPGFDHHPGFNSPGWDRREGWNGHYAWTPYHGQPGWWFHHAWALPLFVVLEGVYPGVWSCTAIDSSGVAHGAASLNRDQAVYNALYDCGGLPIGAGPAYCYVPGDYCRHY